MKNIRESQLPEVETLRRIVSTFDLPEKKFERNDFRQSKHVQFTQQSESLNLNAQIETDLVFDEQKQLRNVRARFDLNRENLQMKSLEVTLRQKGLPEVAQKMVEELTRHANVEKLVEEIKQIVTIRSKEELNQKINRLIRSLNLNKINLNNKRMTEQIDISINVRIADKTVLYLNMKDIQEYTSILEQNQNQYRQIVDQIFDNLTGDNALTLMLSNKQHRMPTIGMPIHSGHSFVIVAALKNQNGAFFPSIATDFHYEMGFTIMKSRPAVHYHIQTHSALGLKVNVERKNGVPTKFSISMPENRLEVFSIKSTVRLQHANNEEHELKVSKNQRKGCTRVFSKIFGAEWCQETVYPKDFVGKNAVNVLFNGPYEFSLYLQKTDSSIKHWVMTFETPFHYQNTIDQATILNVAFNTVGSRINREVSAKVEFQNENDSKILHIDLKTPVKSAKIEGRAQWTEKQVGLKAALIMNNQRFETELSAEKTKLNGEQHYYKPTLKLTMPGLRKIHYIGEITLLNNGKKENFQIELKDVITNQQLVKASFIKSGKIGTQENFKLATDLQGFWFTGSSIRFVSNIQKDSSGILSDLEVIHSIQKQTPTKYQWKVALKDLSNNQVSKYNADFELNVPYTEFQNVALSWNYAKEVDQIESEMTAFWNKNGQKSRQVHILQQLKMNKVSAKISSLWESMLKIEVIPMSIQYEIQTKTNWQRSVDKYNVQMTARDVKTNKLYKGELSYNLPTIKPLKMNLEAKVNIENNQFKISHNIEEQENQQYHGRTMVQLKKDQKVELNYVYKMKENSLRLPRLNHELDAEIRIPSKSITIKHKSGLKLNANQFELKHSLRSNNVAISDVKIMLNKNGQSQLIADNKLFQAKIEGDVSQSTKQINVSVNSKQYDLNHQTKLIWSGKQQIKVDSETIKSQKQLANVSIDYQKDQNCQAEISIHKLGHLVAKHQPNEQQWATVEISSDKQSSRQIKQKFTIEKQANRYTIRSKTHQNQQIVSDFDLEMGSTSSLKVSAFDWKLLGKTSGKEMMNLVLENSKKNLREELEMQYTYKTGKITFRHLKNQKKSLTLVGQLSTTDESKVQVSNEHANFEFSIKPIGESKHVKIMVDDKKHNVQHNSQMKYQNSNLIISLDHKKDNQIVINHNSKFSINDDSQTKTETKYFTFEASTYKQQTAAEIKFTNRNGLIHQTNVEMVGNKKAVKFESFTHMNGKQILNVNADVDSLRKINVRLAQDKTKEMSININLKDQEQKRVHLEAKLNHFEIDSKWTKEASQKDQKYTLDIVDKKQKSENHLLVQHQRKTMFHVKFDSQSKNAQLSSVEMKLHRQGEAFLKINGKNLNVKTQLDFASSPVEAIVSVESKKHSVKHQTTVTFMQQDNELKINSKTDKNSNQIANVNFRINPTSKQLFASGKVADKNLKIEGDMNKKSYTFELNSENNQFRHQTEFDLNARTFSSETVKNNEQVHKIVGKMMNRRDIEATMNLKEHELTFRSNENSNQYELNYNNNKFGVRSTGQYTISRQYLSAKINAEQRSKQLIDLDANLRVNQKSFDGKLNIFNSRSSAKIDLSNVDKKQIRLNVDYENSDRNQEVRLTVDTMNRSEKQVSAKIHIQDFKIEQEIRAINEQGIQVNGHVERNSQKLVQANIRIESPFKIDGKVDYNTEILKGHSSFKTVGRNEMNVEILAKNSQNKKIADVKSKLSKNNDKINLNVNFDSHYVAPYTFTGEWRKESDRFVMNSEIKSSNQKVGKLAGQMKMNGLTVDVKLDGELHSNGKKSEIVYRLNNSNKLEHVLKLRKGNNYSYGYDISLHLKQGKFIIHLPNRDVELRYDVKSQTNGHILVELNVLPDVHHQPNNIYNIKFDNLISMQDREFILNTKTTVNHPEMHPIEMVFRGEIRELTHQRPLVIFVSYDASSNQQNRISGLFEILNESNIRVAHINISHQNTPILDVHYRWAMHSYMIHQQVNWSILNRQTQKMTGELLGQINLRQRQAKIELNNKHKLQMNWERSLSQNTIVQFKAQTENFVQKTKIVSNNQDNQIEITNYENERIVSNYVVSTLKERNTLLAVEMHQRQAGNKLTKVAFIQLVKDSLNYAKVHFKVEQSLVYEVQNSVDHMKNKIRSVAKKHNEQISSIVKQQYQNMRLDEQIQNTKKYFEKATEDLNNFFGDYLRSLQQYLPYFFEFVNQIYEEITYLSYNLWNVNLEQMIDQTIDAFFDNTQKVTRKMNQIIESIAERSERMKEQLRELKDNFDHEVIVKLSKQLEQNVQNAIRSSEEEGEKVYEFMYNNLKQIKMNNVVERIRSIIVKIKNELKNTKVHDYIHNYIFNQNKFESKWNPRSGEIKFSIWYPTNFISKWF